MNKKNNNTGGRHALWLLSIAVGLSLFMASCYNHGQQTPDGWDMTRRQMDSISFQTTHHYTQNYNFLVTARSIALGDAPGNQAFDTVYVMKGEHVVVADIQTIPTDSVDSVWVKVARDQLTQGWVHETELLAGVSPDDPISEFIDFFSDTHLLIFLALVVVVGSFYAFRRLMRQRAYLVHFNDIDSFLPTLLCILVAASATLYASIQTFGAEQWRHFYFNPSLNPFTLPLTLGLFVASVWAIIIVGVAVVDDIRRLLPPTDAILYLLGLSAVCGVLYVAFSILTLYYVGYPLLVVYLAFAIRCWMHTGHTTLLCGNCGRPLASRGRCPHCGAKNV